MANRRITRNKSFASYVNSINQDVSELKTQNAGGSISAGAISGDSLSETVTLFSSSIQSNNYSTGVAGWKIDGSGVAEFADVYVRGDINAQTGTIGYWNISPVDATRFIGPTKIFGTFLESDDIGVNDEEKTDGVYVSLFKSYFEDPKPITNIRRVSNEAIVTLPGHTLEVGDYVVVIVNEDTTFNTSTTGSLIVEVTADTFTYESVGTDFPVADPTTGITPSSLATGTAQYYQKDTAGIFVKDYGKKLLDYGYFSSDGVKYSSGSDLNAFLNPSFEYLVNSSVQTYSNSSWTSGGSTPSGGSIGSYDFSASPVIYNVSSTYGQGYKWTATNFSNVSTNYLQGTIDYTTARGYRMLGSGDVDTYLSLSGHYQGEISNKFTVTSLATANASYKVTSATSLDGDLTYTIGLHPFSEGQTVTLSGFSNTSYNATNTLVTSTTVTSITISKTVTNGTAAGTLGSATGLALVITPTAVTSAITAASSSGGSQTYTVNGHSLLPGNIVTISGFSNTSYNFSNVEVTLTSTNTFTISQSVTPGTPGGTLGSVSFVPVVPGDVVYLDFEALDTSLTDFASDAAENRLYTVLTATSANFTATNYRKSTASGSITLSSRLNSDGTSKAIGLYKMFSGRAITGITVPASTADITLTIPYHGLSANDHIVIDATARDSVDDYNWLRIDYDNAPKVRIVKTVPTANTITIHNPQYSAGVGAPSGTPILGPINYSTQYGKPVAIYRIPEFRWNATDISFVFSSGNTVPLANVLESTYKSLEWNSNVIGSSHKYSISVPATYLTDSQDVAVGVSSLLSNKYKISSTLFDQSYSSLDPGGKANASPVSLRIPVALERAYFRDMTAVATSNATHIVYTANTHPFITNDIITVNGFNQFIDEKFVFESVPVVATTANTITIENTSGASGTSTTIGYVYGYPSTNKTYVTSNSSSKNVGFIFDDFSISDSEQFFYGSSGYTTESWIDDALAPNVASLSSPGDWINIDLITKSNYLSNVTELTFSPISSNKMFTQGGIFRLPSSGEYSYPSTYNFNLSFNDDNAMSFSSGVLSRKTPLGTTVSSSSVTPLVAVDATGVEISSSRVLNDISGSSISSSNASLGLWIDSSFRSYLGLVADEMSFKDENNRPILQSGIVVQNSGGDLGDGYARSMYLVSGTNVTTTDTSFAEANPAGYFETGPSGAALIWLGMRGDNSTTGITRSSFRIRYGLDSDGNEITNGAIVIDFGAIDSTGSARVISIQGANENTASIFYQFIGRPFTVYRIIFGQAVTSGTGSYRDKTIAVTPII